MGRKDYDIPIIAPTKKLAGLISFRIRVEQKGLVGALFDVATGKISATQLRRQSDHPNSPGRGFSSAPTRERYRH